MDATSPHWGYAAALTAAFCWTISALAWSLGGKRVGAFTVNVLRMILACLFFSCWSAYHFHSLLPPNIPWQAWIWLSLSGIVGFTLGDLCLFESIVLIGPRLAMLMMALAPPFTAMLAFLFLQEAMSAGQILGMLITLAGISWVVAERHGQAIEVEDRRLFWLGLLLGLGGAVGQAGGVVLGRYGMEFYPGGFAAAYLRTLAGTAGFLLVVLFSNQWKNIAQGARQHTALAIITIGALLGPFLGVGLLFQSMELGLASGVAATLVAIVPVLIIPFVILFRLETVSARAALGALVAVVGVIVLTQAQPSSSPPGQQESAPFEQRSK